MKSDKDFVVKYVRTPAGNYVRARVPRKLSEKERKKSLEELFEIIKKIAENQKSA